MCILAANRPLTMLVLTTTAMEFTVAMKLAPTKTFFALALSSAES
jgi:hypothetical protein